MSLPDWWGAAAAAALVGGVCALTMPRAVHALGLERTNFRGDRIPMGYGIALTFCAIAAYAVLLAQKPSPTGWVFASAVVGFGVVGLIDDVYGSREAGGFRGHLALLARGKVSTGLLKMLVGGLLSLALGAVIGRGSLVDTMVNGLVISLTANLLNLLDLRPGRAVSCFWAGLVVAGTAFTYEAAVWRCVWPLLLPIGWLTWLDRRARVMLGDAGSNALGALLGVIIAYEAEFITKVVVIALMVSVHLYSEKRSISRLIDENRALRYIDSLLGER